MAGCLGPEDRIAMTILYRRQMEAARRDAAELCELLLNPDRLRIAQLAEAIGLATMVCDALLRAVQAQAAETSEEES